MTRRGVLLLLLVAAVGSPACTRTREQALAPVERSAVGFEVVADGPWREMPIDPDDPFTGAAAAEVVTLATPPPPVRRPAAPKRPAQPSLALLPRRLPPPPRDKDGQPLGPRKAPDELRRHRYLDNPTRLRAGRVAFYCPEALASEIHLTGGRVEAKGAKRRVATGGARLICRELTLEADKISLNLRGEDPDIQLTARGDVHFVTRQRSQVLREEGIRSLLITNEQIVPLR